MRILVTGGAGYIGSHTCLELLSAGHQVVVVDNLCNAKEESLVRVEQLTGRTLDFHKVDLLDVDSFDKALQQHSGIDAVIHFAGLKAVGESVRNPLLYYNNNVKATLNLCEMMVHHGIQKIIFSSSATVYGDPEIVPVPETSPLTCANPYGRTKLMSEEILSDMCRANQGWGVTLLRYFNPVGAHESGRIGEDPMGVPNNLMPYVAQVAVGKLAQLDIFGNDYATHDGTGVRDYIHVVDLALGHVKALEHLNPGGGLKIYNLGTGKGYSVLDLVAEFSKACGSPVPYRIVARRPGDVAKYYADPSLAHKELGWRAQRGLREMCEDTWRWQRNNPEGY